MNHKMWKVYRNELTEGIFGVMGWERILLVTANYQDAWKTARMLGNNSFVGVFK